MTQDRIIELARQVGMTVYTDDINHRLLERFAALVRAQALEEAAAVCEEMFSFGALEIAAAIRALKEKT